jgi:hypothetical protein
MINFSRYLSLIILLYFLYGCTTAWVENSSIQNGIQYHRILCSVGGYAPCMERAKSACPQGGQVVSQDHYSKYVSGVGIIKYPSVLVACNGRSNTNF